MLTFTAIDYETANNSRASACSVGYAVVQDGYVVRSHHEYICPPTGLEFTNSWLHGITAEHCEDAPDWISVMHDMVAANPGAPLVSYSSFDKGVWNAAWDMQGDVDIPPVQFLDALPLARKSLELPSYRLPTVAAALNIPSFNHHNAEDDALACARIVLEIAAKRDISELAKLWPVGRARR